MVGILTKEEGPLTQERAQSSSTSHPAPHRKRCHGDGVWPYCSWNAGYVPALGAPMLGRHCLTSSSVVFLGPGVGEMWGASLQAGYPTAHWDKDHLL